MNALDALNVKIFELRRKQEFEQAVNVFKKEIFPVFSVSEVFSHERLLPNVMFCLRKSGRAEGGIAYLVSNIQFVRDEAWSDSWLHETGWILYDYFKAYDIMKSPPLNTHQLQLMKMVLSHEKILENKMLYLRLMTEAGRVCMVKGESISSFLFVCKKTDPEKLDVQAVEQTVNREGRIVKTASEREKFFMLITKAFYFAERYEECVEWCEKALEAVERFYGGGHVWITRKMALALLQLGDLQKAIEKMKSVLKKKNDWFLWKELAGMLIMAKDFQQAEYTYLKAALLQGHTPYKAGLYMDMIREIYKRKNQNDLTFKMIALCIQIRLESNWKIPDELLDLKKQYALEETLFSSEYYYLEMAKVWAEQIKQLKSEMGEIQPKSEIWEASGVISRVLNEGSNGDGFITSTDNQSVYFRLNKIKFPVERALLGKKVKFKAVKRTYKGKEVWNALIVSEL